MCPCAAHPVGWGEPGIGPCAGPGATSCRVTRRPAAISKEARPAPLRRPRAVFTQASGAGQGQRPQSREGELSGGRAARLGRARLPPYRPESGHEGGDDAGGRPGGAATPGPREARLPRPCQSRASPKGTQAEHAVPAVRPAQQRAGDPGGSDASWLWVFRQVLSLGGPLLLPTSRGRSDGQTSSWLCPTAPGSAQIPMRP